MSHIETTMTNKDTQKDKEMARCEVCDSFECNCFCKCGLPHDQCVCDFKQEDWETNQNKSIEEDIEKLVKIIGGIFYPSLLLLTY